jgi:hypothetical protein
MKCSNWFGLLGLSIALTVAGCKDNPTDSTKTTGSQAATATTPAEEDADVKASLAKLSPDDQRLARAQRLCPVSNQALGSMDVPPKVMIEGQPVFLCCKHCEEDALAKADKTLAKVKDLKEKTAAGK